MLQPFLMWYLKTTVGILVWGLKSTVSTTVWFLKNFGPAMVIAFIPTFVIGTIAILLFGSTGDSVTGGYLMTAPVLTQRIIGVSFFGTTVLVYVLGWQVLWEAPKAIVGILSEIARDVRTYIQ